MSSQDTNAITNTAMYSYFVSIGATYPIGYLQEDVDNEVPSITVLRSIRDLDENKSKQFIETFNYKNKNQQFYRNPCFPIEIIKPVIFSLSHSQKKSICIKAIEKRSIIEFSNNLTSESFRIDASSIHGDVIGDSWFAGASWSSDERYFAYVAKENVDKKEKYENFGYDSEPSNITVNSNKYEYSEDWGEKFDGIKKLCICILDTFTRKVSVVPNIDTESWTCGQPCFVPRTSDNDPISIEYSLVYTAWNNKPRKLGMIYCYQRKSSLFYTNLTEFLKESTEKDSFCTAVLHKNLTCDLASVRSPRFNSNGSKLVFLGRSTPMKTHNGCMQLFCISNMNFKNFSFDLNCLIEIVMNPNTNALGFPGIYCDQLPRNCFMSDELLLFNSSWKSSDAIISYSFQSKSISKLSDSIKVKQNMLSSFTVLDVFRDWMLIVASSPCEIPQLCIYNLSTGIVITDGFHNSPYSVSCSRSLINTTNKLPQAITKLLSFDVDGIPFESFLVGTIDNFPSPSAEKPLIVIPHGGPHSVFSSAFIPSYTYLMHRLNAFMLFVNYRGSSGFGEESILSLPGKCGRNDVDDIITCINKALTLKYSDIISDSSNNSLLVDKSRLYIVGGSHGGFLTAHLIGQFPNLFKACCMRNPVTNIPSMTTVSDIPDWCWVESGLEYDFNSYSIPNSIDLIKMYECSPIKYIEDVKTPTLICLGQVDKRVPPSQGIEYYHLLKSRNIDSKLLIYPDDCHAIDKPCTEGEHWISIGDWLDKY